MLLKWELLFTLFIPVFSQKININNYKLPLDIESLAYNLTLDPHIDTHTFDGNLIFTFRPLKNVSVLILNSKNLLINTNQLYAEDDLGYDIKIKEVVEDKKLERLMITPLEYFKNGRIYAINIKYKGNITEDGAGLYRSSYIDKGTKQWFLATQMRPVHTRKVFPCFDQPNFRARFSLAVWHDKNYHVISNMPRMSIEERTGSRSLTAFQETPPIPVFLTGFLVSKLDSVPGRNGFTSLAIPEEIPAAAYSAEVGPKLASALEAQLNILYPQSKTDQVALPFLIPVAMENWGLFNFKRENILYLPGVSPTVQKQTVARFSGHEVSHAWLGNSVTIAWWNYLWLSEMFAMYLEYFVPHLVYPTWRMDEQMAIDLTFAGLEADSPAAESLTTAVLTPAQISAKFSGLTYTKAPGLLRMVQHALTYPNFFNGIKNYLEKYWEKSVVPGDLWGCLQEEGTFPAKLENIMYGWTNQPGYPVVIVTIEDGMPVLKQKPFSIDEDKTANSSWWIPITVQSSEDLYIDTSTKYWLPPNRALKIPMAGNWILLNVEGAGYFRTQYHPDLFSRLSAQLRTDHLSISPLSRAKLVDDAVWLSRAGLLDIQSALGLISYLEVELDFIAWKSAAKSLEAQASFLQDSKLYPLYKNYVLTLLHSVYTRRGLHDAPNDTHVDKVQREIVVSLACRMGMPDCIRAADDHINALMSGNTNRISPDVQASLFCTAVSNGRNKSWEFFSFLFKTDPKGSANYLAALACTTDPEKIKLFLIDSIPELHESKWLERFSAMSSRKENANYLLNILHKNINIVINKYGINTLKKALLQFTKFLNTKEQIQVLQDIERLGVGGLSQEVIKIKNRSSWIEKNSPFILHYFKTNFHFSMITTS